jgi:hypothetical protein
VTAEHPVLKKLFYRGQSPVLLLDPPDEFGPVRPVISGEVHTDAMAEYGFILAFVTSLAAAEALGHQAQNALSKDGIFWLAYPKGSSRRYKVEINRDTANAALQRHGFTGVAMVSLDDDWSALRLKPV